MNTELTVFYADDDIDDLDFFRDVINSIGKKIKLFTHDRGDNLLNALRNPPPIPQIIFLDLNMPGKSGFDVLEELKSSDDFKDIPVVAFSTSSDDHNVSKCMKLGASFYVTKSTSFDSLKKSIEHTLNIDWENFKPSMAEFIYKQK